MGYELSRLMKQYGVATPGMARSTLGAAPAMPEATFDAARYLELNPDVAADKGFSKDPLKHYERYGKTEGRAMPTTLGSYAQDLATYATNKRAYDQYANQYVNRLASTPMYADAQYRTSLSPQFTPYESALQFPQMTTTQPLPTTVTGAYQTYLGRDPDAEGLAYWQNKFGDTLDRYELDELLTVGQPEIKRLYPFMSAAAPATTPTTPTVTAPTVTTPTTEAISFENQYPTDYYGGAARGGSVRNLAKKYNVGGAVRKFNIGGNEGVPEDAMEALIRERSASMGGQPPVMLANAPTTTATDAAPVTASPAVQPVTPPPSASTPVSPAANDLMSMMSKYLSADSTYQPELAAARKRVTAENAAFQDMIAKAMQPDSSAPDKAEMYFRLAAAFGAPTKTGHFTENLALVGKELGEYSKDVRAAKKADKQLRLQLGLEAQKLKSQAARDELTTLRTLAGEEMKDKRAILQEYIKSGMPQSEAGKAAMDAGLVKGTPQFNEFVNKYIDDKIRSGNLLKEAMVAIAAGNLAVAQSRESRTAASAQKLTAPELKLKAEAEDALGAIGDAMSSLSRAYSLNPNTFDGTLASIAQQKILEQTNPKDPRVLATREQQNLLSKGAIANLRTAFGGNPTEGERKALLDLEGIDAKSKEERAIIMKNTYKLLKRRQEREQKRLKDITSGLYRETTPSEGGIE